MLATTYTVVHTTRYVPSPEPLFTDTYRHVENTTSFRYRGWCFINLRDLVSNRIDGRGHTWLAACTPVYALIMQRRFRLFDLSSDQKPMLDHHHRALRTAIRGPPTSWRRPRGHPRLTWTHVVEYVQLLPVSTLRVCVGSCSRSSF